MLVRVYTYTLLYDVAGQNPLRRRGEEARWTWKTERPQKKDKDIAEEKECKRERERRTRTEREAKTRGIEEAGGIKREKS